jgi:dihydrofolate reductase
MSLIIIACMSNNRVIGKDGSIPWKLPTDLKRFQELTLYSSIIMGSKTYEILGKPLLNRTNIVLSRTKDLLHYETEPGAGDVVVVNNKEQALVLGRSCTKTFIIGGGEIYQLFIEDVDSLYLSILPIDVEGDTYFPDIDPLKWKIVNTELIKDGDLYYKFIQLRRFS